MTNATVGLGSDVQVLVFPAWQTACPGFSVHCDVDATSCDQILADVVQKQSFVMTAASAVWSNMQQGDDRRFSGLRHTCDSTLSDVISTVKSAGVFDAEGLYDSAPAILRYPVLKLYCTPRPNKKHPTTRLELLQKMRDIMVERMPAHFLHLHTVLISISSNVIGMLSSRWVWLLARSFFLTALSLIKRDFINCLIWRLVIVMTFLTSICLFVKHTLFTCPRHAPAKTEQTDTGIESSRYPDLTSYYGYSI